QVLIRNWTCRDLPQMNANPRKLKVSGLSRDAMRGGVLEGLLSWRMHHGLFNHLHHGLSLGFARFNALARVKHQKPRKTDVDIRLAQDIAAPPNRFDIVATIARIGEFLAQLAHENVDDLKVGFVHAAVEMVEKRVLCEGGALAQ